MTIDWWTLGLQTINVLILVWLLGRFFWRPVAAIIEQRRAAAQQILAEAEAKCNEASAALADIEKTRAGFAQERETVLAAAHEEGERERGARLQAAATEAESQQAAARAAMQKEQALAEKAFADRASRLAVEIAGRLVARLDGAAPRAAFLDWLLKEIRDLPDATRQAVAADGVTLEAISAAPLDPTDEERYRKLIAEALGAQPRIVFKADPGLIAGLELRGPQLVVNNSWRSDLDRILADLTHDNRI
ncbi:ATP synthase subunit b [Methylocella tundrae]|uniref:ATP synthase subunit b n=1 Tax=Methylocella tundrae TaxID=227605 RepID=A0A8B6M5Q2_METTU|nr:F0F1 ATP synthase subunit delta [Methylocella tundrae]VTZ22487.1 ATP synthase subunit b [Methylocella tundrae]VTZ50341.1 ATP synthase subunit b [Methylocella tundrae]